MTPDETSITHFLQIRLWELPRSARRAQLSVQHCKGYFFVINNLLLLRLSISVSLIRLLFPYSSDYCIILLDVSSLSLSAPLAGSPSLAFQRSSQSEEILLAPTYLEKQVLYANMWEVK
jgi:hypothetical protein